MSGAASKLHAGLPPPAVLRARLVPDAEEVLVLSYTADLRFFERLCLAEARAVRARVTVVHDVDADLTEALQVRHAGVHYTDVPVRCRSEGEFHPKLMVVAGSHQAVVMIGSGNATTAGWHHNAELWTTLEATPATWPHTFHDLADWLDELPEVLHVDSFGSSRLVATAQLLRAHPSAEQGPRLLHNLRTPLADQLPHDQPVDRLHVASPFVTEEALDRLVADLAPRHAAVALTRNAVADPEALARWSQGEGRTVHEIVDSRYYHGKLVQWTGGSGTNVLTGSANVTSAALLRTTRELWGNCELGVLVTGPDLWPPVGPALGGAADIGARLIDSDAARRTSRPRLLRVLLTQEGADVTLVGSADVLAGALLQQAPESWPLVPAHAEGRLLVLRASGRVNAAGLVSVQLLDGTVLGPTRPTDAVGVTAKPGTTSPLEDVLLARVLTNPRLSDRLFEALAELARLRPPPAPGGGASGAGPAAWRAVGERAVGSALLTLALGGHGLSRDPTAEDAGHDAVDYGDAVDEHQEADALLLLDPEVDDVDTALRDPFEADENPVAALVGDPAGVRRLRRLLEGRLRQIATAEENEWSLPARLALLRVGLVVLAGGGWSRADAPNVAAGLQRVVATVPCPEALRAPRDAACLVALAVLRACLQQHEHDAETAGRSAGELLFEQAQRDAALEGIDVEQVLVEHYAADLYVGLGEALDPAAVADARQFLVSTSRLDRFVESLQDEGIPARLAAPRLLEAQVHGTARPAALRLLTRALQHAPVAVRVQGSDGHVYVAWLPRALHLQMGSGADNRGGTYVLSVGPGAHVNQPLPKASRTWTGRLPEALASELIQRGLLDDG